MFPFYISLATTIQNNNYHAIYQLVPVSNQFWHKFRPVLCERTKFPVRFFINVYLMKMCCSLNPKFHFRLFNNREQTSCNQYVQESNFIIGTTGRRYSGYRYELFMKIILIASLCTKNTNNVHQSENLVRHHHYILPLTFRIPICF